MSPAPPRAVVLPFVLVLAAGCSSPDPQQVLQIEGIETYWAIDRSVGHNHYIAPVVRFSLRNKDREELRSIQAQAVFRRKGEETQNWGGAWEQVTPVRKPLQAGQAILVVLTSDARYYSAGPAESMFQHQLFKDAKAEVFVRVGSSPWVKFGEAAVERRIGSRSVTIPSQ